MEGQGWREAQNVFNGIAQTYTQCYTPHLFSDLVPPVKSLKPLVGLRVVLVELLSNVRADVAKFLLWGVQ